MAAPARGDILYRGASGWKRLPPGLAGQALISGGASADPAWTTLSPGGVGGLPYMYPFADAIDDPINDNFSGAAIDTTGSRFSGASAWTAENIGASTVAQSGRKLWLTSPASASLILRGYRQPVPSGNWCIRSRVTRRFSGTSEHAVGLFLYDATAGKIESFGFGYSGGNPIYWAGKWTTSGAYSATRSTLTVGLERFPAFLEIEYDGTNYYYRSGFADGAGFVPLASFAATNFLAAAASAIGVFSYNSQSVACTLINGGIYRVTTSSVL